MSGHVDAAFGWSVEELADKDLPCRDCLLRYSEHPENQAYVPDLTLLCERCRGTGVEPADPLESECAHCNGHGWYE